MPTISFVKSIAPIEVEKGANLMESLLGNGRPVASSCGGDGVCARCRIQVIEGMENLSPTNTRESILREQNRISGPIRISCQTLVLGDVKVDAAYW